MKKKEFTTNENQGNSNPGPICAVQPAEWTVPIRVTTLNAVRQALSQGQDIAGNLILAKSFSEVQEPHTLWSSFGTFVSLTVLCDAQNGGLGGALTKVSLKRHGGKQFRAENMHLWPLGTRSACPWVRPAVKADIQKFQPATKVVIRVNAPEHYRKFFKTDPKPDSPADILTELASLQLTKASVLSGGDWRRIDQLIGHLRVSPELAQKLVLCSGRKGIFLTQTKVTDRRETTRWIEKQGKEDLPDAATGRSAGVALLRKAWEGIFNGPPGYNSDYQNFFDIYSPWLPEFPSFEVGAIELEEFQAVII